MKNKLQQASQTSICCRTLSAGCPHLTLISNHVDSIRLRYELLIPAVWLAARSHRRSRSLSTVLKEHREYSNRELGRVDGWSVMRGAGGDRHPSAKHLVFDPVPIEVGGWSKRQPHLVNLGRARRGLQRSCRNGLTSFRSDPSGASGICSGCGSTWTDGVDQMT